MHHKAGPTEQTSGSVLHAARSYALFSSLISLGRKKLITLAAAAPGESVLDVGCGPGNLALALKMKVGTGDVHGIDASPEMIDVAKKKAAKAGLGIDFRVAAIEALPFPDASFDLVTSSLMLHHLPDDAKRAGLREVRRVLKPGGRFLAVDLATPSHSLAGHLRTILGPSGTSRTVEELAPMMRDAGFDHVETLAARSKTVAFLRGR